MTENRCNMRLMLQDIPPRWARFCLDVKSFTEDMTGESIRGKRFLAAYSGGADSAALLRIFDLIRPGTGISITAAHLNHMLRPGADDEQEYVTKVCADLGISVRCGRSRVSRLARAGKTGIEEAARTMRYNFLQGLAVRQKADYILTGHHLNDLAEDMLMRLSRGTGWPGLSGMAGFDPRRKLVRPLILTPKKIIVEFLEAISQDYLIDESNQDTSFLRNRIRHEIVPAFEEINPGFLSSVANIWKLGRIDQAHWESVLSSIPEMEADDGIFIPYGILGSLNQATRLRLFKKVLDGLGPGQTLSDSLLELDRIWKAGKGGKTVQFPGDKFARIKKRGVLLGLMAR